MKNKTKLFFIVVLLLFLTATAGCNWNTFSDKFQIRKVAISFLRQRTNLDYRTITGLEGKELATENAIKKMKNDASRQVAVYKEAQGSTVLVGQPQVNIVSYSPNNARVEGTFTLQLKTKLYPDLDGKKKNFRYVLELVKKDNKWLVNDYGFSKPVDLQEKGKATR